MAFNRLRWYEVSIRDVSSVKEADVVTALAFLADEDGWVSRLDLARFYPSDPGVLEFFADAGRVQLTIP